MTDIPLNWVLPSAVALAGAVVAVTVYARGKNGPDDLAATDSWERTEERRRRKEALYGSASYVLLFCCAAVAAALSFHGLVGFGRQNLGLWGGWEYLVPFGLDGAAMFCSVLAVARGQPRRRGARLPDAGVDLRGRGGLVQLGARAPRDGPRGRTAVLRRHVAVGGGPLRPRAQADPPGRAARTGGWSPARCRRSGWSAGCGPRARRSAPGR
ncbi:hypothetical protein GCM10020221_08010 [Streptomyces thioluteus]|uniref:DUF2637 domain-containing protein n=1 Tax=Streptomyces thioluteus TaxID=66431 RepID=A0ABN3WGJ2_STRTU